MRKPSDLKMYVNNQIKECSQNYLEAEKEPKCPQLMAYYKGKLEVLFEIQKICETRKKY